MSRTPGSFAAAERSPTAFGKNILGNGDFIIAQRGTSFTSSALTVPANDVYLLDRWYLLFVSGTPTSVDRVSTSLGEGMIYAAEVVTSSSNDRAGFFQMLESEIAIGLAGKSVSLSVQMRRNGVSLSTGALAIWTTTTGPDSEASDVVSSWASTITPGGNWVELASTNVTLTDSFVEHKIENVTIPAGTQNIVVGAYMTDATSSTGVKFYAGNFQMEYGKEATEFQHLPYGSELASAQRYLYVYPCTNSAKQVGTASAVTTTTFWAVVMYPQIMRATPTLAHLGDAALFELANFDGTAVKAVTAFDQTDVIGTSMASIGGTNAASSTQFRAYLLQRDGNAGAAQFIFSSEV